MADDLPEFDLYASDFYVWTQTQAEALRLRGAGGNALDYDRLAEEVGDLGAAEWNTCTTLLVRITQHLYKLEFSPAQDPRNKWRAEVRQFRVEIEERLTRSIRNGMEAGLDRIHARGAKLAQSAMDDHDDGARIDPERRWTLPQLLGEADDPLDAVAAKPR